jgi:hypothetical protein
MRRRIQQLPPVSWHGEAYRREDYWRAFLSWEHEARRMIRGKRDFMHGDAAPYSEDEISYNDEEDEDDEMEDVPPPVIVKLEAAVHDDYDEEVATAAALAASMADEESKWPGLEDAIQLLAMVAEHVASLPPPPPLPPQYMPQPPQYAPPPEVTAWAQQLWTPPLFVVLVSDDEEDRGASN